MPIRSATADPAAPGTAAPSTGAPETDVLDETAERLDWPWRVILFNDDDHTFEEVIAQVIKATGCSWEKASGIADTVHNQGKAVAYEGPFEECFRVQGVLREIALVTQIEG